MSESIYTTHGEITDWLPMERRLVLVLAPDGTFQSVLGAVNFDTTGMTGEDIVQQMN